MTTTSGASRSHERERLRAVGRLAHDLHVGRAAEQGAEAQADDAVVVGEDHTDARRRCCAAHARSSPDHRKQRGRGADDRALARPARRSRAGRRSAPRARASGTAPSRRATARRPRASKPSPSSRHLQHRLPTVGAADADADVGRLAVAHRVAERLLRDAVEDRGDRHGQRVAHVGDHTGRDAALLARAAREELQRRDQPRSSSTRGCTLCDSVRTSASDSTTISRMTPSRSCSGPLGTSRSEAVTSISSAVSDCAVESCSSRAMCARSWSPALMTCGGERAHAERGRPSGRRAAR